MLWFVPDCENILNLVVGMTFDSLEEVEEFYKSYTHECGFSVRIGAQGKKAMWLSIKDLFVQVKDSQREKLNQVNKRRYLKQDVDAMPVFM
jgi:hypothetical protein